jgi:hypothetical protein
LAELLMNQVIGYKYSCVGVIKHCVDKTRADTFRLGYFSSIFFEGSCEIKVDHSSSGDISARHFGFNWRIFD